MADNNDFDEVISKFTNHKCMEKSFKMYSSLMFSCVNDVSICMCVQRSTKTYIYMRVVCLNQISFQLNYRLIFETRVLGIQLEITLEIYGRQTLSTHVLILYIFIFIIFYKIIK